MQQAAAGQMRPESPNIGVKARENRSRSVNGCGFTGNPPVEGAAERFEPLGEPAAQRSRQFVTLAGFAVETRPPFDKGTIAIDDRRDAQGGLEALDRQ